MKISIDENLSYQLMKISLMSQSGCIIPAANSTLGGGAALFRRSGSPMPPTVITRTITVARTPVKSRNRASLGSGRLLNNHQSNTTKAKSREKFEKPIVLPPCVVLGFLGCTPVLQLQTSCPLTLRTTRRMLGHHA